MSDFAERLLATRSLVYRGEPLLAEHAEEEGGCGVTGFACTIPVRGKFIYEPSVQMQNRGNGKGGGIAAVGLVPEEIGVSREVLSSHYLLQIALLEPTKKLLQMEKSGDYTSRLAMLEELKTLPFGAVWDYYCQKQNVLVGLDWLKEERDYEAAVTSLRK